MIWLMSGDTLYLQDELQDPNILTFDEPSSERGPSFRVSLRHVRVVRPLPEQESEYLHIQNILVREILDNMGLTQLGRAYFNPRDKSDVPKLDIEIWPGKVSTT